MRLTELQKVLGEQVIMLQDSELLMPELAAATKRACSIATVAKQMINNADIIIRYDKLQTLAPEQHKRIGELI